MGVVVHDVEEAQRKSSALTAAARDISDGLRKSGSKEKAGWKEPDPDWFDTINRDNGIDADGSYPELGADSKFNTSNPWRPKVAEAEAQKKLAEQLKIMRDMNAKDAAYLANMAEMELVINLAKAKEAEEVNRRIAEEVAKARAEMEASYKVKEIAKAEAKFKADVDVATAAKEAKERADSEAEEKAKGSIRFKDALGRKFSFPFELCKTWKGMSDLICQAFEHVEPIGQLIADGNYDLVGPSGEVILPEIWETVIEPDWTITMHMWPMKEVPKAENPPGLTHRRMPGPVPGGPRWTRLMPSVEKKPRKKQGTGWTFFGGPAPVKKSKQPSGVGSPTASSTTEPPQSLPTGPLEPVSPKESDHSYPPVSEFRVAGFTEHDDANKETEQQDEHTEDDVERSDLPPPSPITDFGPDKEQPGAFARRQLNNFPSEVPLPRSPPPTPPHTNTPDTTQTPSRVRGARASQFSESATLLYNPHQYEQVIPQQQKRSSLLVIWAIITCVTFGTISLVILTFGTTTSLISERTTPHTPTTSDAEFSLTLQACGWQITNLIAGLIPACMHANRYRKWLRMNYAWLPAVICLVMVVASVPVYLRSPALSNGLAGVANIPMGLFIFFATYEALREERGDKRDGSGASTRSSDESFRKGSEIELHSIG